MPAIAVGGQRETGTAHALNALYEADRVVHTANEPEIILTPSASGKGQKIARCPTCRIAVWSIYPQAGPAIRFVRVGQWRVRSLHARSRSSVCATSGRAVWAQITRVVTDERVPYNGTSGRRTAGP